MNRNYLKCSSQLFLLRFFLTPLIFTLLSVPIFGQTEPKKEDNPNQNNLSSSNIRVESIRVDTGVLIMANEVYDTDKRDIGNPVVSYTLGATVPIFFTKNFFLSPSLLFFTSIYAPSELTGLAFPADSAEADTLTTLGMWLDISAGYRWNFSKWELGAQGGVAFLFRIPLWGPASEEQRTQIAEGLYKEGRFIYISTGVWIGIPMTDKMDLSIRYKTEVPIFNIWNTSGLSFLDQWGMSLTIGFAFRI